MAVQESPEQFSTTPVRRRPSIGAALFGAVVGAALAVVLGTLLHSHVLYVGQVPLPWGALAALILAGAVAVTAALYGGRLWLAALTGALTYAGVALAAMDGNNWLIVPLEQFAVLPGPALAGGIWLYGLVVSTVVALLISARALRR